MNAELERKLPGVVWNFSQNIRDNVMEALSGIKGDNSVKIFGPDLDQLEVLAAKAKNILQTSPRASRTSASSTSAGSRTWSSASIRTSARSGACMTADVNNVVSSALGAKALSSMVEGEKLFDIAVRWPKWRRSSETSILDIPVDIVNNTVVQSAGSGCRPVGDRHGLGGAVDQGCAGRHRQPDQQHAAAAAARPGVAGGRGRRAGSRAASSSATAPRRSTASRASG